MERIDAAWLKHELKARNISQMEFARAAGIPDGDSTYVNKVLNGKRELKHDETLKTLDFLRRKGILAPPGFSEGPLSRWEPANDTERAAARHIAGSARSPMYWALDRDVPAFALLRGDVVVVDNIGTAPDGALLAARQVDAETGDYPATFIARRIGAHLWTGDAPATAVLLPLADSTISIVGPVMGSFRRA